MAAIRAPKCRTIEAKMPGASRPQLLVRVTQRPLNNLRTTTARLMPHALTIFRP